MNDFTPADKGTLAADLENLAAASTMYIPELAGSYATANLTVADCVSTDGMAASQVVGPFEAARDAVQSMLYRMATTLESSGEALYRVAEHYAAKDSALAEHLRSYLSSQSDPANRDRDLPAANPDTPDPKAPTP